MKRPAADATAQTTAVTHTIQITVDEYNNIVLTGDEENRFSSDRFSSHADRGDAVDWCCEFPFAVVFNEHTPFTDQVIVGAAGTCAGDAVPKNKASGSYKYSVVVFKRDGVPLYADPELIIR